MPPSFTVIIPVLNEEKTLDAILDRLGTLNGVDQFIIVNDGSTDRTPDILKRRLDGPEGRRFRVITHDRNRGKGASIRSALAVASTEFLAIQDADQEYDPADLEGLLARAREPNVDVVYGSRFLRPNPNIYPLYRIGNRFVTWVANLLGGGALTDAYTCYKVMRLERWRALELESDGFEIEAEITIKALLARWRIEERPVRYAPRTFSQGKKIRGSDALKGALTMLRCRLTGRHPARTS